MGEGMNAGETLNGRPTTIDQRHLVDFEKVIWHRVANVHSDPAAAQRVGMARPIASGQTQLAFLHELFERDFGDGWVRGGRISVRWVRPLYLADVVTPCARVVSVDRSGERPQATLEIWCENQRGEQTAVGTAQAYLE